MLIVTILLVSETGEKFPRPNETDNISLRKELFYV